MAKVTKRMLKGIVKECLVEILSEGLGDSDVMVESSPKRKSKKKSPSRSIFDQMDEAFHRKPHPTDNISFDNRINDAAAAATSDPILQEILSDTARTTLQDQLQHETRTPSVPTAAMGHGLASPATPQAGAGLDISSLFGEATRNWGEVLERTERKPL